MYREWFTWYCTHTELHPLSNFFLSYPPGNKSDKERKTVRKILSFINTKRFRNFLKDGYNSVLVQFYVYHRDFNVNNNTNSEDLCPIFFPTSLHLYSILKE